jgi:hypothetical protein
MFRCHESNKLKYNFLQEGRWLNTYTAYSFKHFKKILKNIMKKQFIFILGIFFTLSSFGQDLHEMVSKVFDFSPHKMTLAEQKATIAKLDTLFEFVMKNKDKYIEPLRNELRRSDNNPYFYFDGGVLLMQIIESDTNIKSESDIQLIADALVKTDLKDLTPDMYLDYILGLSLKGANVIDAAFHALEDSTFKVIEAKHSLTLNYGDALIFILPRYQPDLYVKKLISTFELSKSVDNKISLINLFIHANCCEADEYLNSILVNKSQPKVVLDEVKDRIKLANVLGSANEKKYLKYFEMRKEILFRISDEAIYELNDLTMKMRKAYKCVDK